MEYLVHTIAASSKKPRRCVLRAVIISLALAAVLTCAAICFGLVWETNDDPANAWLLSRSDNGYAPFQGQLCSAFVHALYRTFPQPNWWLIYNCAFIGIGAAAIFFVFFRRFALKPALAFSVAFAPAIWLCFFYQLNFTRTAIFVALAGCALIADAVFPSDQRKPRAAEYVIGCVLLLIGQQTRSLCALIALAILAAFGLCTMFLEKWTFCIGKRWDWFPKAALLFAAVAVAFGGMALDSILMTEQERSFVTYNELRASIQDYPDRYVDYEQSPGGLASEDLDDMNKWFSEDTEVYSEDVLLATQRQGHNVDFKTAVYQLLLLVRRSRWFVLSVALYAFFFLALCLYRGIFLRGIFAVLAPPAVTGTMLLYLVLKGRMMSRVSEPVFFGAALCYILAASVAATVPTAKAPHCVRLANTVCFAVLFCLLSANIYHCANVVATTDSRDGSRPWDSASVEGSSRMLLDAINEDNESVYFFMPATTSLPLTEINGTWAAVPGDFCSNLFYLGGWDARLPHNISALQARGIDNPARALFEKEHVYVHRVSFLGDFLRRHYDERISESVVRVIYGRSFSRFLLPVDDNLLVHSSKQMQVSASFTYDIRDNSDCWMIEGHLDGTLFSDTLFCNLTVNGKRYTYCAEVKEDGTFRTFFYNIPRTFIPENADIVFFSGDETGRYAVIASQID